MVDLLVAHGVLANAGNGLRLGGTPSAGSDDEMGLQELVTARQPAWGGSTPIQPTRRAAERGP